MNTEIFQTQNQFLMLALDHRGSFLKLMNPTDPSSVTSQSAVSLKRDIITAVEGQMSGVLIDADYGLPAYQGFTKPFLLPMEKSGYGDDHGERTTELMYSAKQLKEWGAAGAKLLLYFNPRLASADSQLQVAREAVDEAHASGLPLFLEIVTYDPADEKAPVQSALVIESLEKLLTAGVVPDVWKLEYPGDDASCAKVTSLVGKVPWILLTRGEQFETFTMQLKIASQAGARGFLAGRALWQEVCTLDGEAKQTFLTQTLPARFKKTADISVNG